MKHGNARGSMPQLIEDVQRESALKGDFGISTARMEAIDMNGEARMEFLLNEGSDEGVSFRMSRVAHEQLNELCKMGSYYKRLLEMPTKELWATNVNQWLPEITDRLVRTFDGEARHNGYSRYRTSGVVRCLKSSHYRVLDNDDLLAALLPQFEKRELNVLACNLSERHMVIKAVSPRMEAEVPKVGDKLQAGIAVGNSEVGCGSLWISSFDYFLSCTNGVLGEKESKWVHRSGKAGDGDADFNSKYTSETQEATNKAFWAQVTDEIDFVFDESRWNGRVQNYGEAAGEEISRDDERGVFEVVCSNFGIPKEDVADVLRHYHREGQENRYGVAQAVTRYAQDVDDYDLSCSLESDAWKIIEGGVYA